jgi:two-component system response regulator FlrC
LSECYLADNDVIRIGDWVGVVVENIDAADSKGSVFSTIDGVLVGPRSRSLWRTLAQVAASNLPIVIEGESGTGKEVVAAAIHRASKRSGRYIPVNCAAQPEALFEANFFGHAKGAFTGALHATDGFFTAADGGTLFLDELVDLDLTQQAKILRAVEERKISPVGSTQSRPIDVRIVAAAQRSLALVANEGNFRHDLRARLSGMTLKLVPLRARREEVLGLFVLAYAQQAGLAPELTPGFVELLCAHGWDLNVREVVAVARRCAVLFSGSAELSKDQLATLLDTRPTSATQPPTRGVDMGLSPFQEAAPPKALPERTSAWLGRNESVLSRLQNTLRQCGGNVSQAARAVGISRQRAQRLLEAAASVRPETNNAPELRN